MNNIDHGEGANLVTPLLMLQWSNNDKNEIKRTTTLQGKYGFNSQDIPIVDEYLTPYDVNGVEFFLPFG